MKRINHQEAYSLDVPAPTMLRNISAACAVPRSAFTTISLARICSAMRRKAHGGRDNRRVSNGDQVSRVAALAMKRGKSVDFTGYWQLHVQN